MNDIERENDKKNARSPLVSFVRKKKINNCIHKIQTAPQEKIITVYVTKMILSNCI